MKALFSERGLAQPLVTEDNLEKLESVEELLELNTKITHDKKEFTKLVSILFFKGIKFRGFWPYPRKSVCK